MLIALGVCAWCYLRRGRLWAWHMDAQGFASSVLGADDPARIMGLLHWDLCRYVLAMLVMLAAMQWRAVNVRPLTYLGTLTIGIYMLHFSVMKYADLLAWSAVRLPGVPETAYHSDMLRFVLVWGVTVVIVATLKVTPGFKRFV
jgi:fucose 4-O-acetylase-like acetyltransferase